MTRLTTLIIRGNSDQIECLAGGPVDGKYAGWIFYNEDCGEFFDGTNVLRPRPLVNTDTIYMIPKKKQLMLCRNL